MKNTMLLLVSIVLLSTSFGEILHLENENETSANQVVELSDKLIRRNYEDISVVGYWKFDEGSEQVTRDSSGNGFDGILVNGPTWVDGIQEKALDFDGINDYVEVPDNNTLNFTENQSFTIGVWVRTSTGDDDTIVNKGQDSGFKDQPWYVLRILNGKPEFRTHSDEPRDKSYNIIGDNKINDGNWHHIAGVRNLETKNLYLFVDGKSATTPVDAPVDLTLKSSDKLYIGRGQKDNNYFREF